MDTFQAAAVQIDLPLASGLPMDGYSARTCLSEGFHDPLQAQILIIAAAAQKAIIVTLDVLAVSAAWSDALREDLAAALQTTPEAILICASHTHCGPCGLQNGFPMGAAPTLDSHLIEALHEKIVAAALQASTRLIPATLSYSVGRVEGIAGDRNQPERTADSQVSALCFEGLEGRRIAVLFHFACHPTILGPATCQYSADFPGVARRRIEAANPGAVCLYLNGAAGNLSTRFTRREQSFAEVNRLGGQLGEHVIGLLRQAQRSPIKLDWAFHDLDLPFRAVPTPRAPPPPGADRRSQSKAEGAAIEAQLGGALKGQVAQRARVSVLHIGEWRLIAIPGEPFDSLMVEARRVFPLALIVGYANDYLGYFPTQAAIDEGAYEALSSPYDARAHDLLCEAVTSRIPPLRKRRGGGG